MAQTFKLYFEEKNWQITSLAAVVNCDEPVSRAPTYLAQTIDDLPCLLKRPTRLRFTYELSYVGCWYIV